MMTLLIILLIVYATGVVVAYGFSVMAKAFLCSDGGDIWCALAWPYPIVMLLALGIVQALIGLRSIWRKARP